MEKKKTKNYYIQCDAIFMCLKILLLMQSYVIKNTYLFETIKIIINKIFSIVWKEETERAERGSLNSCNVLILKLDSDSLTSF